MERVRQYAIRYDKVRLKWQQRSHCDEYVDGTRRISRGERQEKRQITRLNSSKIPKTTNRA